MIRRLGRVAVVSAACASISAHAAPAAPAAAAKPESPFLLCDGRTGHVGAFESLVRLAAITATAGLSEAAVKTDNSERKMKGDAGAAACATAIAQEGNPLRRTQLAMARAIHLLEADKPEAALAAAREVATVAGPFAQDWGYHHTLAPRVALLEGLALMRLERVAEADATLVRAAAEAPYDVALMQRIAPLLALSPTLDPAKDRLLARTGRWSLDAASTYELLLVATGRFADAERHVIDRATALRAFTTKPHPEAELPTQALLAALQGDTTRSDEIAARYDIAVGALAGTSYAAENANTLAVGAEAMALRKILCDAARGQIAAARASFVARGQWLLLASPFVDVAVDRLRAGASPAELTGPLAQTVTERRDRRRRERMAALSEPESLTSLLRQPLYYAKQSDYTGTGGAVWKVTPKGRFELKPFKEQPEGVVVLSTEPRIIGLPAGEATLLHAALIARARAQTAFVVAPIRLRTTILVVRFGMLGQEGFAPTAAIPADQVIADLQATIPPPPKA